LTRLGHTVGRIVAAPNHVEPHSAGRNFLI
jgi:hypothetical protein